MPPAARAVHRAAHERHRLGDRGRGVVQSPLAPWGSAGRRGSDGVRLEALDREAREKLTNVETCPTLDSAWHHVVQDPRGSEAWSARHGSARLAESR
jgi:hypothetical protein